MNGKKIAFNIGCCVVVCVIITEIRNFFVYHSSITNAIIDMFEGLKSVAINLNIMYFLDLLKNIPRVFAVFIIGGIAFLIGYGVIVFANKKVLSLAKIMKYEFCDVVKKGLVIYMARVFLIFLFAYSIIGIPVAVFILVTAILMDLHGMVAVAVNIGNIVQDVFNGNDRRMSYNYIIGAIVMMMCVNVHAVGITLLMFIFPVVSVGAMFCATEKRFLNKPSLGDANNDENTRFDRRKIRDIITKEVVES